MLHTVWTSNLMGVFWLMTIVSSGADPWEKVREGSLSWEWDEWNLFLVSGIRGCCTGAVVMGVSSGGAIQWGRRAGVMWHTRERPWAIRDPTEVQNTMGGWGGTWRVSESGSACAMWSISFLEAWPRQYPIPSKLSPNTRSSENPWPIEQLSDL